MESTKFLPKSYQHESTLDLSKDKRLAIGLNLLGIILFLLASVLFVRIALFLRQEDELSVAFDNVFLTLLIFILSVFLAVVVHEAIHGLCFWLLTKGKPKFGFKGLYAYAAAPDWYLPRTPYFVVALAPFVIVTFVGVLLLPIVTQMLLPFLLIWLIFNFAGSIGDITVVIWLLRKPPNIYINDFGDGVSIYCVKVGAV